MSAEDIEACAQGYLAGWASALPAAKPVAPPWGPLPTAAEVLLARSEVTLCCACINPDQCHRRIVARLLVACGAVDCGERPERKR